MNVLEVNVDDIGMGGVFSLVKNVIKHNQSNVQIDIASIEPFENKENATDLLNAGCQIYYIGFSKSKIIKQIVVFFKLFFLLKKSRYECIHIHADVANKLLVSALAGKIAGVEKIVLHSHASGVEGKNRFLKILYHKSCRIFLKYLGDEFLTCSDYAARWMFPNVNVSKIRMVKNGVDLGKFRFDQEKRDVLRKKMGLDSSFVVGHVGRFSNVKNHAYLVDVFEALKRNDSTAKLLLVGDGELRNEIETKINDKGLRESVIFFGTTNDVASMMMVMDVFLLPSYSEGFPIVGIEAQAAGLPIVFSTGVTQKAKLTSNVSFLPITRESIPNWVGEISKYLNVNRNNAYDELFEKGFDISYTVKNLMDIYKGKCCDSPN